MNEPDGQQLAVLLDRLRAAGSGPAPTIGTALAAVLDGSGAATPVPDISRGKRRLVAAGIAASVMAGGFTAAAAAHTLPGPIESVVERITGGGGDQVPTPAPTPVDAPSRSPLPTPADVPTTPPGAPTDLPRSTPTERDAPSSPARPTEVPDPRREPPVVTPGQPGRTAPPSAPTTQRPVPEPPRPRPPADEPDSAAATPPAEPQPGAGAFGERLDATTDLGAAR